MAVSRLCRAEDWLGREDSNLRMAESKSAALPLGYAPPCSSMAHGSLVLTYGPDGKHLRIGAVSTAKLANAPARKVVNSLNGWRMEDVWFDM
jgi:hypothetical protein